MTSKSSKDQIKINFNEKSCLIKRQNSYKDTLKEIQTKFSLSKFETQSLQIEFQDSEGDLMILGEDNFDDYETKNSKDWNMNISQEKLQELQEKNNQQKISQIFEEITQPTEEKIQQYQTEIKKMCIEIMEQKLKEIEEQNEKELKNLEKKYQNDLENFRKKMDEKNINFLKKVNEETCKLMEEVVGAYDANIRKELDMEIEKEGKIVGVKIKEIQDLNKLKEMQENMKKMLIESQTSFKDILNPDEI